MFFFQLSRLARQNVRIAELSLPSYLSARFVLNVSGEQKKIIWRFSDGRAGHDAQSMGFVRALSELVDCESYDIGLPFPFSNYAYGLIKKFPRVLELPDPDLAIGAGHASHGPLLLARYVRGGKALVFMKPSLPAAFFDICLIPWHDKTVQASNIIHTEGPLNSLRPSSNLSAKKGLILVGGKSKHFDWNDEHVLKQINIVLAQPTISWTVADSPRTPASTRALLQDIKNDRFHYLSSADKNEAALSDLFQKAGVIWVSEDSMSMIYESLSTGAAIGILSVPKAQDSRLAGVTSSLSEKKLVTLFDDWSTGQALVPPTKPLLESQRCALAVASLLGWSTMNST